VGSNPSTGSEEVKMKVVDRFASALKEFRAFALRANAFDLAIGVALGAAFTAVIQAIVSGLFTPFIGAIFGKQDFSKLYFTLHGSRFVYGLVVNTIVTLFIVAIVLFFVVVKPLNALRRRLGLDRLPHRDRPPGPPMPGLHRGTQRELERGLARRRRPRRASTRRSNRPPQNPHRPT
jgi:large conductance mechanosensitive channel